MFRFLIAQKTALIILFILFLLPAIFCLTLTVANANQTIWGLSVGGFKIGGLGQDETRQILSAKIDQFQNRPVTLTYASFQWQRTPAELGLTLSESEILTAAAGAGHQNNWLANLQEQIHVLAAGQNLALIYRLDNQKFDKTLTGLTAIQQPAQNAAFKYNSQSGQLEITPSEPGRVINQDRLIADILQIFSQPQSPIRLSLIEDIPRLTADRLTNLKNEAQIILDQSPFWLQNGTASWPVGKTELAEWLSATPADKNSAAAELTLDQEKIKDFLAPLATTINREPTDATLTWADNAIKFVILPQNGAKLAIEASAAKIATAVLAGEKNISLVIDEIPPELNSDNLQELGIKTRLGQGESNFAGSPKNRQHNITIGAQKLNGLLIKSGEEFSFAKAIGEIDAQNGWLPELVIKNYQTIPEYGGGLCQVSTTLFRAALDSGLKITERYPHAYPVTYYNPQGFDATVYPPSPDLKFINDTPSNIILQNKIVGTKLFFEVYGTADGRQVKIIGPTITQKNSDGSMKTILTQEIWRDGVRQAENIFRSSYKSPNLYPHATASPLPVLVPSPSASPVPTN